MINVGEFYEDAIMDQTKIIAEELHRQLRSLQFPRDRSIIARLSYDQKMEWYATRDPRDLAFLGNDKEFERFWKWRVVVPLKLKRFFYRVKSGQVFKHYAHITEMKEKVKKHSI